LAWSFPPNEFKEVSLIYTFFGGIVGVCAFILPGISGSFILLLLGIYELVIISIKDFNLIVLSSLFAGCLVGLLLFIRVVKKAYEDYPDHLLGFFYSLVLLSIPLLWKSDEWKISLPDYQLGYIEAFSGLILGVFFIFLLQKLSSTFRDI
jgi:putative membrane protein